MHDPDGVFETRVHRPWIDVIGPGKLPNSAEALENRSINDRTLPVVDLDEAVDRAADFVFAMRRFHLAQSLRSHSSNSNVSLHANGYSPVEPFLDTEGRNKKASKCFNQVI